MNEQTEVLSINYAPNPLKVRLRVNKLAIASLFAAVVCAMLPIALLVAMFVGRLYSIELVVLPFVVELSLAGFAWRQIRRNREYQCGQSLAITALILTAIAALPSIYLSATIQDRLEVNGAPAVDVLTVSRTWNPPHGARVARTRCVGRFTWYELRIPVDDLPSYRQAVIAHEGPAASTMSPAGSLHFRIEEDPDWFSYSAIQDPQLFTFAGTQTTDEYIFSAKQGRVLVRQTLPGS